MRYIIAGCLVLSAGLSHAQTLVPPTPSSSVTQREQCPHCSPTPPLTNSPNRIEAPLATGELPSAPSATVSLQPDAWNLTELTQPEIVPRRDTVWDKKTWAAHIVLAGSMIFDVEMTHQGLAHHQCVEGNTNLPSKPSRSELYIDNLEQFAPMVVMDWLGTAALRAGHLPRWAWKASAYAGPIYGSTRHIRGGISWYTRCW